MKKIIKHFTKLHGSYCSNMGAAITFLEREDVPPVSAEVLVKIAKILKSAHEVNLESIIFLGVELENAQEALQTKLQSLN
jgi:hypothetical protein